ncbi:unnamed protein product, partial [Symbiodinium sp. CCMP2456]
DEASGYSDASSVRTATTIREFFREERRWVAGSERSAGGYSEGRPPRLPLRGGVDTSAPVCVLPCVPPGKVPGGRPVREGPSKADIMYAPRPTSMPSMTSAARR